MEAAECDDTELDILQHNDEQANSGFWITHSNHQIKRLTNT
jgi:hypothetical protein